MEYKDRCAVVPFLTGTELTSKTDYLSRHLLILSAIDRPTVRTSQHVLGFLIT